MHAKGIFSVIKNGLIPADERSREIMNGLRIGEKVLMHVHKARYPEHHRLAFGVFQKIANATGMSVDTLVLFLKWETGYVDLIRLPNGKFIPNPRSLSFESMSQDDFKTWWDEAWPIITEKILPKIPQDVFDEVRAIVAGERKAA